MKRAFSRIEGPSNPPPLGGLWDYLADQPSIPMESSERGAAQAKHIAKNQVILMLRELERRGAVVGSPVFLSRDDLIDAVPGLTVNSATGRLGPSGQMQTQKHITATEDKAGSRVGNRVVGYQITEKGIAWAAKWRNAA